MVYLKGDNKIKEAQKKKLKIFIDFDGVISDWLKAACESNGLDENKYKNQLKNSGVWLDHFIDEEKMWKNILKEGVDWWANLDLLPWAKKLVDTAQSFGNVAFLTSPGNIYKHTEVASHAAAGKVLWANKHFKNIPLIIAHKKELLATYNSILIDDSTEKIEKFEKSGGNVFLWPNQYKIIDDESINDVLKELTDKLRSIS